MKFTKILLIAIMVIITAFAAISCGNGDGNSASDGSSVSASDKTSEMTSDKDNESKYESETPVESQSESKEPEKPRELGVMFGNETEEGGLFTVDYRNALAGFTFFDKTQPDEEPIMDDTVTITVEGETLAEENYDYTPGNLELTEEYIKSLELGKVYKIKASFVKDSIEFTVKFTDEGSPALKYLADDVFKNIYLVGSEIELPVASKSPSSIQNISATYTLKTADGTEVSYVDNKFVATEGNYVYTATFMKNDEVSSEKENEFVVIDLATANLAAKDVAVVFGGNYDETEGASKYIGTNGFSEIVIPESYKYVRISYKGEGTIACGDDEIALSAEDYTVARLSLSELNGMKIVSENGLYIKDMTVSEVSAFNIEDVSTLDFTDKEFFPLWGYNESYGTPVYNDELSGISFTGTANSWPYTLQKGIIKTAYDNGYKYLVITYSGKGTTRVYNNTTGDWGGFSRDLAEATTRRVAYNLDEAVKKIEIDETASFSIITDKDALVLTELRFFETDVVIEEEGIYNEKNLVAEELTDKWSHNASVSDAATYNSEEGAMSFPANANGDTFNFEHEALRKAQKKGYTAVKFLVKGSAGEVSLFVETNWGRDVKFAVNTSGEYVEGILYFGDLIFNEKSGVAILSSNDKGGDPVLIKEMRFTYDVPPTEPDYTEMNLASGELLEKWYYNSGSGVQPSYDEAEGAMIFPANGNYDTYTLSHAIVKTAKAKGYNAVKFTVKGANASLRVFMDGSWNSDAIYNIDSENKYATYTMHFAHLDLNDNSGITFLVSDAAGGRALYVKELVFAKIEVSETVMNLMTGNLVSKDNINLWVSDGKGGTISYDEENGYAKFDFTAASSIKLNVNFGEIAEYIRLFGRTKIVWSRAESSTDNYGRVRLYETEEQFNASEGDNFAQELNILGAKVGNDRVLALDITGAPETAVFAIHNKKVNTKYPVCNIMLTEVRFA